MANDHTDSVTANVVPNSGTDCITCPICYQDFTYSTSDIKQQQQQQQQQQPLNDSVQENSQTEHESSTSSEPEKEISNQKRTPILTSEQGRNNNNKSKDDIKSSNIRSKLVPLAVYNPVCQHKFCLPCIQQVLLSGNNGGISGTISRGDNTNICTATLGNCPVCRSIISYFDLRYCSNPSRKVVKNTNCNDNISFPTNLIYSIRSRSRRYYDDDDTDDDDDRNMDGIGYCSIHFPSSIIARNNIDTTIDDFNNPHCTTPYLDITNMKEKSAESLRRYSFIVPYILPLSSTSETSPDKIPFYNINYSPSTKTFQGDIQTSTVLIRFIISFSDNWNCIARGIIVFMKLNNSDEEEIIGNEKKQTNEPKEGYYTILDKSCILKVEHLGTSSGIIYRRCWNKVPATVIYDTTVDVINQTLKSNDDVSRGSALKKLKNDPNENEGQDPSSIPTCSTNQQVSPEKEPESVGDQPTYYNSTKLWGNVFCQGFQVGLASYHFVSPTASYISYETSDASLSWPPLDNGYPIPSRVYFRNVRYDAPEHKFYGRIQWFHDFGTTWQGFAEWDYTMQFDSHYITIVSGIVNSIIYDDLNDDNNNNGADSPNPTTINNPPSANSSSTDTRGGHGTKIVKEMSRYGTSLIYCNASIFTVFRDIVNPKSRNQQRQAQSDDHPTNVHDQPDELDASNSSTGNIDTNTTGNTERSSRGMLSTMSNLLNVTRRNSTSNNQNSSTVRSDVHSSVQHEQDDQLDEQQQLEKKYDIIRQQLLVEGVSFRNMTLIDYLLQLYQSKPNGSNPIKWNFK